MSAVAIRCDTPYIFIKQVPFVEINPAKSAKDNYKDLEKELLNVSEYQEIKDDGWAHNTIARLAKDQRGGSTKEWQERGYLLFVCMGGRSGLPHNETVECILTVHGDGTRPVHMAAFGDAFVFASKTESRVFGPQPVDFNHMSLIFVMQAGEGPQSGTFELWPSRV